ncbi:MAG: LamB/YcsF family protein [Actinomycetota bacterium]|nr:LamB/YcsF family protein [Actinomycetota bacterium]
MDLNSDLGESFGPWRMGDDGALLALVSSANVACGFHAGDPLTMLATCRQAVLHGVRIGAHVSYRDLAGFGRRAMEMGHDELHGDVLYQLSALDGIARSVGAQVSYVKPHGALYNRIVHDREQAAAVCAAVRDFSRELPVLGLAGSEIAAECLAHGVGFFNEAFVDRGYRADGTLVPRGQPGDVLHDVQEVARRALQMAVGGSVEAVDGSIVPLEVDSLCVHGDTPGAVQMAQAVRAALAQAGVVVDPFC